MYTILSLEIRNISFGTHIFLYLSTIIYNCNKLFSLKIKTTFVERSHVPLNIKVLYQFYLLDIQIHSPLCYNLNLVTDII